MKKAVIVLTAFLGLMIYSTAAFAELDDFTWPMKIKRGAVNILTSPIEIPKQVLTGAKQEPRLLSAFSGLFKGIAYTGGRMVSGFWDVFTCNLDVSDKPLMKPNYVFDEWPVCEHAAK